MNLQNFLGNKTELARISSVLRNEYVSTHLVDIVEQVFTIRHETWQVFHQEL